MTQEQKDLLLKDLCARLPYSVKFRYKYIDCCFHEKYGTSTLDGVLPPYRIIHSTLVGKDYLQIEKDEIKPYLFPLSSMTDERKKEISKRYNYHNPYQLCVEITNHSEGYWDDDTSCNLQDYLWLEDWFHKNHFDYRGLIEKELAIDATGLNIY